MKKVLTLTHQRIALYVLVSASLFIVLCSLLLLPSALSKLLFDLGEGSFFPYPITIQNLMWLMFFFALVSYSIVSVISNRAKALMATYLPEGDDIVLTQKDVGVIYGSVKSASDELGKNLVLHFQAGQSVEQTHQLLNFQLEMWQARLEYQLQNCPQPQLAHTHLIRSEAKPAPRDSFKSQLILMQKGSDQPPVVA